MKKFLLVYFALFLIGCFSSVNLQGGTDYSIPASQASVERARNLTVSLVDEGRPDEDGQTHLYSYCSGTIISPTEVLTAAHCVQRREVIETPFGTIVIPSDESPVGDSVAVVTRSQFLESGFNNLTAYEVTRYDRTSDLALLLLVDESAESIDYIRLSDSSLEVGTPLFQVGHPLGVMWNVSTGFVSTEPFLISGVWRLASSVHVAPGNSGGGIYDIYGNLVGVVSQGAQGYLNLGISIQSVREFLN